MWKSVLTWRGDGDFSPAAPQNYSPAGGGFEEHWAELTTCRADWGPIPQTTDLSRQAPTKSATTL
eukprot:4819038-Alexandrium_andersonii.AAC.1